MHRTPIWEVDLYIIGPISLAQQISLNQPKGFELEDPFYSDVNLININSGIKATVTAYASTSDLAYKAALLFIGHMLDALSFRIFEPLYLSLIGKQPKSEGIALIRRRVEREEWESSFQEARLLALAEPSFLRALGWFRKGLYTEDPYDRFLAFYNSVEIVTTKYHPQIPEGRPSGTISQMWESFKSIWGENDDWPIIAGDEDWIDRFYRTRVEITHGVVPISIDQVEKVMNELPIIEDVSHRFLTDWRNTQLEPVIPPELERKFGY